MMVCVVVIGAFGPRTSNLALEEDFSLNREIVFLSLFS
jgi:hypothetical protein